MAASNSDSCLKDGVTDTNLDNHTGHVFVFFVFFSQPFNTTYSIGATCEKAPLMFPGLLQLTNHDKPVTAESAILIVAMATIIMVMVWATFFIVAQQLN